MNPQLLQLFLPYLMQLFGQGGQNASNPLTQLFGQNGTNMLSDVNSGAVGWHDTLQPASASGQPAGTVTLGGNGPAGSGQTPVTGTTPAANNPAGLSVNAGTASPQSGISPTGAPQSLSGIWNSLLTGLQNNSLSGQSGGPSSNLFGG